MHVNLNFVWKMKFYCITRYIDFDSFKIMHFAVSSVQTCASQNVDVMLSVKKSKFRTKNQIHDDINGIKILEPWFIHGILASLRCLVTSSTPALFCRNYYERNPHSFVRSWLKSSTTFQFQHSFLSKLLTNIPKRCFVRKLRIPFRVTKNIFK